jgi:hypothetical protein
MMHMAHEHYCKQVLDTFGLTTKNNNFEISCRLFFDPKIKSRVLDPNQIQVISQKQVPAVCLQKTMTKLSNISRSQISNSNIQTEKREK